MKIVYQDTSLKKHLVEWHISFRTEDFTDDDKSKRFVKYIFNDVEAYKQNEILIKPAQTLSLTIQTDFAPIMYNGSKNYDYIQFYRLPTDFDVDFH